MSYLTDGKVVNNSGLSVVHLSSVTPITCLSRCRFDVMCTAINYVFSTSSLTDKYVTSCSLLHGTHLSMLTFVSPQRKSIFSRIVRRGNNVLMYKDFHLSSRKSLTGYIHCIIKHHCDVITAGETALLPRPRDCSEWRVLGRSESGVYEVCHHHPSLRVKEGENCFSVYCDMDTDGGGWTVSIKPKMNLQESVPVYLFSENIWVECIIGR